MGEPVLVSFDCANCGGNCSFNVHQETFSCPNCSSEFHIEIQDKRVRLWIVDSKSQELIEITDRLRRRHGSHIITERIDHRNERDRERLRRSWWFATRIGGVMVALHLLIAIGTCHYEVHMSTKDKFIFFIISMACAAVWVALGLLLSGVFLVRIWWRDRQLERRFVE